MADLVEKPSSPLDAPPASPGRPAPAAQICLPSSLTLISSDGHALSVDPLLLAGSSKVFADMLTGSKLSGGSCDVTETKVRLEHFLSVLQGGRLPLDFQGGLDEGVWLDLYRMGDKYDCAVLQTLLLLEAKQVVETSPIFAYAAGKLLGDPALAYAAAQRTVTLGNSVLDPGQAGCTFKALPRIDRLLLERFQAAVPELMRISLDRARPRFCTGCGRGRDQPDNPGYQVQRIWDAAAKSTLCDSKGQHPWTSPLTRMWSYENDIEDDVRFCCKTFIDQRIDRAEKDYEAFQTTRLGVDALIL
ncbi:hypothetical protein NBRC10512_000440 [Rhodotorula toruloides]|uniref:RHTO0S04e10660g1_1 n=2 Tax=Rhodotorula toruloides TaxID=5286 RepID=A0A061AWR6_RHOTO|nr:uncharacterized protein RHTO_05154 [Rhodotorula toruloides NP11]EMS19207.1 hypothetical protein RHTO_05154 [Rhodotorula toruloides NP11]CDR39844.1 RHTO0S04e10660g1_1 [Rhodotorula toruloides]